MVRHAVVVDPSSPARLRALREERRLSHRDLSRLAAYSHTIIREVETGRKSPTPEFASRLDEVLATGGVLPRLVTVPALQEPLTADDADRLGYIARHPQRVDAVAVGALSVMLADYRQREDAIGSTPLLVPVTAELGRIGDLLRDAHGPVRHQLVDVAAQWAQFLGWLNTATSRPVVADTWLDRARCIASRTAQSARGNAFRSTEARDDPVAIGRGRGRPGCWERSGRSAM